MFQAGADHWVRNSAQNEFAKHVRRDGGNLQWFIRVPGSVHEIFAMPNDVMAPYLACAALPADRRSGDGVAVRRGAWGRSLAHVTMVAEDMRLRGEAGNEVDAQQQRNVEGRCSRRAARTEQRDAAHRNSRTDKTQARPRCGADTEQAA